MSSRIPEEISWTENVENLPATFVDFQFTPLHKTEVPCKGHPDAQRHFKSLKKEEKCPLCLYTMKKGKTLPRLHSLCLECLDELANLARKQQQTLIKCPVCRTSFPIPDTVDTFTNLSSSFDLNRLVDVLTLEDGPLQAQKCNTCDESNAATSCCFVRQRFLRTCCFDYHQRCKATRRHRNVLIDKLQAQDVQDWIERPIMCSQKHHKDEPLEIYCEDCEVFICHKCCVVSHSRHKMSSTRKTAQEQLKIQITEAVTKLEAEILVFENEIKQQTGLKKTNSRH